MSGTVTIILITVILVLLAVAGLSIGLILTGRSKLRVGRCGWDPSKKKDKSCGRKIKCPLCEKEPEPDEEDKEEEKEEESADPNPHA